MELHSDSVKRDDGIEIPEADTNDQKTQRETGTTANCQGNNLELDLLENQNSPERWGSKSANRIRSPWYKR